MKFHWITVLGEITRLRHVQGLLEEGSGLAGAATKPVLTSDSIHSIDMNR